MNNVISLKAFRTLKETQKLFAGYRVRVGKMDRDTLLEEIKRYREEAAKYPHHLLTVVKGEILMGEAKTKAITQEFRDFATKEEQRLKGEVYRRLHEEWLVSTASQQ